MTRASRWALIASTIAVLGAGLVLAFLLSITTSNPSLYERHYVWLFWVNVGLASVLMAVIVVTGARLLWRVSRGRFGSRLLLKLAAIFALVGVVPGLLIYMVSYQFVSRSIESWFDVRVEGALDAGLALGRGTIDGMVADLDAKARLAADRLGETGSATEPLVLERLREQLAAQEIAVVGASGQLLASTGAGSAGLLPDRPAPQLLRQARTQRVASVTEGLDEDAAAAGTPARLRAVALIPSSNFALGEQERFLVVTQRIAPALVGNALAVTSAYREYQQRALARSGLRKMYIGTLTLALVLAVFAALLLAVALSNQLVRPLLLLAEGVDAVTRGDFRSKAVFASRDELGGLTRSFAQMTEQLSDARELVHKSVAQVEGARANLQTILDNLTAGVIVFDRNGAIESVNPGATRILRLPLSAYRGRRLGEVPGLETFAESVAQRFEQHAVSPEAGERDQWQDSFELRTGGIRTAAVTAGREAATTVLLVRGAAMPQQARLLVFDDITEVVSAQRIEAWSEVARRLAHEIKNPLTPIQRSAERLLHKLGSKVEGVDHAMLERSVGTIVNQVQAMKSLVDEFRDYARLPASQLGPLDLNALVGEVLGLYATEQESGVLATELDPDLPRIVGDATQLRQVIHNLMQNALDAVEGAGDDGKVRVATEVARHEDGRPRAVRLVVRDNGPGFDDKVMARVFEPYVTTKTKGSGLGLAVVKKIADEHAARVRIANLGTADATESVDTSKGAQVSLSFSRLASPPDEASREVRTAMSERLPS